MVAPSTYLGARQAGSSEGLTPTSRDGVSISVPFHYRATVGLGCLSQVGKQVHYAFNSSGYVRFPSHKLSGVMPVAASKLTELCYCYIT